MNNSESQVGAPIADFRSNYYAVYIQDNWKMTPNVTVDFGLRWEYDQPFTDVDDKIVNIDYVWDNSRAPVFVRTGTGDPYEGNPPFSLGSIPYVRDGRFGRGAYKPDYNDFAPRLGLAWSLNPETVVRAGGGIYYVRDIGNAVFDTVRNAPFTIRRNEPAETFRPNLSFEQPFARTGSPTFILAAEYDVPSSYIGQWSLGFQRELPGSIIGRSDLLRIRGRAPSPPADLQQHRAECAGEHQPLPAVPRSGRHAGHERAESFELPRALSQGAKAVLARPQFPELVLLRKIHRQRQRRPYRASATR